MPSAGPRPKGEERRAAAAEEYHRLLQEGAPPGTKYDCLALSCSNSALHAHERGPLPCIAKHGRGMYSGNPDDEV